MTLAESGTLEADVNFLYLCTLVCREELRQFDSFSTDVEITKTLNMDYIIRGLSQYFFPVNSLSKQKCAIRLGMKKPPSLTVILYVARLIDLNEYLESFPGATLTDNIVVTELN